MTVETALIHAHEALACLARLGLDDAAEAAGVITRLQDNLIRRRVNRKNRRHNLEQAVKKCWEGKSC